MKADGGGDGAGASSLRGDRGGVGFSSRLVGPTKTRATLANLARVMDREEVEMQ